MTWEVEDNHFLEIRELSPLTVVFLVCSLCTQGGQRLHLTLELWPTPKSGCHWFREVPVIVLLGVSHLKVAPTQLSNEVGTETIRDQVVKQCEI